MKFRILKCLSVLFFSLFLLPEVHAQLGKITFDLEKDKPQKFKTKTLKSEKTGQKKFTVPRRFIQNTVSHYNYFYNANNKINDGFYQMSLLQTFNPFLHSFHFNMQLLCNLIISF